MRPSAIIDELCRRHGVSSTFGKKLLPLVERAQVVAADARARIMDLVERSFVEEARRTRQKAAEKQAQTKAGELAPESEDVLSAVAAILHQWDPPAWLRQWSKRPKDGEPDGA